MRVANLSWLAWHVDMFWRCSKRLEREISQTQRRAHDARKERGHGVLHSMAALSKRLHRAQYAQAVEAWSIGLRVNESAVKRCPVLAAKLVVAGRYRPSHSSWADIKTLFDWPTVLLQSRQRPTHFIVQAVSF